MKTYKNAYKHYLNEDALMAVMHSKVFRRLRFYWMMAFAVSFIPAFLLSMSGIRKELFAFPNNMIYWISIAFVVLSLACSLVFLIVALKHSIFKKKGIVYAITFSPFAAIVVSLLISFTAIKVANPNGGSDYNVIIPLLFQLLIGFPLAVFYLFFCYYAFIDRIQDMSRGLLDNEIEIYKQEAKASNEELKKQVFQNITYKYHAAKAKKKED